MAAGDASPPSPPGDLARRRLPLVELAPNQMLFRIHRSARSPIWFGRGPGDRFNDPEEEYGVLYASLSDEGAFAETCLRDPGLTILAEAFLRERSAATLVLREPLRLVRLHGPGLAPLGADASVASGAYAASQLWSRALWAHPEAPDGLLYRARHDDDAFSVALFDRIGGRLGHAGSEGLMDNPTRLAALLDRYKIALV